MPPGPHISQDELKEFLDSKVQQFNQPGFLTSDPISIPHLFTRKQDIEIAGFLTATLSWGQRSQIIRNARELMLLMEDSPYEFICAASKLEMNRFRKFYYRTFNGQDCLFYMQALNTLYTGLGGLEQAFYLAWVQGSCMKEAIGHFRESFFRGMDPGHTGKHFADPMGGSSAKRINMFLRWMVRNDNCGVDFGLWKHIPASALHIPLDVHSGNVARKLQLLRHKQNDWKAVEELTKRLQLLDPDDPVKYDFALFGLGIFEKF